MKCVDLITQVCGGFWWVFCGPWRVVNPLLFHLLQHNTPGKFNKKRKVGKPGDHRTAAHNGQRGLLDLDYRKTCRTGYLPLENVKPD